jgi:FkbM family methyltransferase
MSKSFNFFYSFIKNLHLNILAILIKPRKTRLHVVNLIKKRYWSDLNIQFEIRSSLLAPIAFHDSFSSFREIFVEGEYSFILSEEDIYDKPRRWLDLGSNNGYFSLFLASLHSSYDSDQIKCLMIDPDHRSKHCANRIIEANPRLSGFMFMEGAIGPSSNSAEFVDQEFMQAHILNSSDQRVKTRIVNVLSESDIINVFPPPYDLIKVDIEGSEFDFLKNYKNIIKSTNRLIIEWHSWNNDDISNDEFHVILKTFFRKVTVVKPMLSFEVKCKIVRCCVYDCLEPIHSSY